MKTLHPLPRARGLVVAAVGLGLPVLAHLSAGGSVSVPPVTMVPLALVVVLCVAASAKTWTLTRLSLALTGVGVATHAALVAGHGTLQGTTTLTHHSIGLVGPAGAEHTGSLAGSTHSMDLSLQMVVAHVSAVALSVLLLRHGEKFLLWLATQTDRRRLPEVGAVPALDLRRISVSREAPPTSSDIGCSGRPRAPPLLTAI